MPFRFALLLLAFCLCAQSQTIHLKGDIKSGKEYRSEVGHGLLFILNPSGSGWLIKIAPKTHCDDEDDWAMVVNPPYRGRNTLYLDTSYGFTAKQAVSGKPQEFNFVLTCEAYRQEMARLQIVLFSSDASKKEADDALAQLGTSPQGKGRLTIVAASVSRADEDVDGKNYGKIARLKFKVSISIPAESKASPPQVQ